MYLKAHLHTLQSHLYLGSNSSNRCFSKMGRPNMFRFFYQSYGMFVHQYKNSSTEDTTDKCREQCKQTCVLCTVIRLICLSPPCFKIFEWRLCISIFLGVAYSWLITGKPTFFIIFLVFLCFFWLWFNFVWFTCTFFAFLCFMTNHSTLPTQ